MLPTNQLLSFIWSSLALRRRLQAFALLAFMLISGLVELISLGAVIPFLASLSNPELVFDLPLIGSFLHYKGFTESYQLLVLVSSFFGLAALFAGFVRVTCLYFNGRLAASVGSDLSCEAYRRTLLQPYRIHIDKSSSKVIADVTSQINFTVIALNSFLQMISSALVAFALFIGLLIVDISVALLTATFFTSVYMLLAKTVGKRIKANGVQISNFNVLQLKYLQEGLGAIRDILLNGSQSFYLATYQGADRPKRMLQAGNTFYGAFPRYAVEALGMIAIAFLGAVLVIQKGPGAETIPLLGAMALGAQKLLPALQQVFAGWSSLRGYQSAMNSVVNMLRQPVNELTASSKEIHLENKIELKGISFSYSHNSQEVIKCINLTICKGERIGLIGPTGSGKSTLVDILTGLLEPTKGKILINGFDIYNPHYPQRLQSWRNSISYVPQDIYMCEASLAENIAFGLHETEIDMDRVYLSAQQAQISAFIESLKLGYETFVGESGIRLSGGQRQRIGIARALYRKSSLIVFDEATSALDVKTEDSLMQSIDTLSDNLTIIAIAHRITTLTNYDRIIRFESGQITQEGPPNKVLPLSF